MKNFIYHISFSYSLRFFMEKKIGKDSINFRGWKMTLKVRILWSLTRLSIILVSLTKAWISEKMLIFTSYLCSFMPIFLKKIFDGLYYFLVSLTKTWISEKLLISIVYLCGFMPILLIKSLTVSTIEARGLFLWSLPYVVGAQYFPTFLL